MTITTKSQIERTKAKKMAYAISTAAADYSFSPALVPYVRDFASELRKQYQKCKHKKVKEQILIKQLALVDAGF